MRFHSYLVGWLEAKNLKMRTDGEEHKRAQREKPDDNQELNVALSLVAFLVGTPGNFPGEMPGMQGSVPRIAGMPGLNGIFSDPEIFLRPCRIQNLL